ncbi:MAG: type II secretion system F family protein [Nitrospinae bacterium]|nr:type II secretion system F family protein [Nitrospinota bacterium]MBF0633930.1 type II secretion system F family protein [Nitrospinota bacterium]
MMRSYTYRARDSLGKQVTGTVNGATELDAARRVIALGLHPIKVQSQSPALASLKRNKTPPAGELISFTSRLSTLLASGVPLESALDTLIAQSGPAMKTAVGEIKNGILEGEPLSASMSRQADLFPEVYTAMVEVGEAGGTLDRNLEQLARFLERREEIKDAASNALRYPKIVVTALVVGLTVLLGWVIPRYAEIFERAKISLPLPTRILIASGHFVADHWLALAVVAITALVVFRMWVESPKGRLMFDEHILKAPVAGPIILNTSLARWADAFGSLAGAGSPLIGSIEIASRACGNAYLSGKLAGISDAVMEGSGISEPLGEIGVVPPVAVQIISTGETAGSLDKAFLRASEYLTK